MATPTAPTSPLLLSRTLDPSDYQQLQSELAIVGAHGVSGAHPHKHWEYALALHAINRWVATRPGHHWSAPIYDTGGRASPFYRMLRAYIGESPVVIVDPGDSSGQLAVHCSGGTPLADLVTSLSVIETVLDPEAFLYRLSCLLAPGGLLVLTFAFWNRCGPDTARDHTLRQRIYCPKLYATLRQQAQGFQLTAFGGVDPTWHGAQVHDYSYASLVLEKRR